MPSEWPAVPEGKVLQMLIDPTVAHAAVPVGGEAAAASGLHRQRGGLNELYCSPAEA